MANFLQLNDPNILKQTRNISWGQALQTENPFSKSYQGYNPSYKGADKTSLKGYTKQGLESLKGNFLKGSNVGGATSLTRKLALTAMDYGPKALGIASKLLGPASFLFNTSAVADATMPQYGSEEYKAFMAKEAFFRRKQKQAKIFEQMKEAELAKQAAEAKADAAAVAAKTKYSGQGAQGGGGGANIRGGQQTSSGIAGGAISHSSAKAARGDYEGWGLADGGLINFYRYGGFSG